MSSSTSSTRAGKVPIAGATKDSLAEVLRRLRDSPEERRARSESSRAYVERVHDASRVADRLLDLYARLE
jgi:glycosyltransferase involved in cell wall biosynthesis